MSTPRIYCLCGATLHTKHCLAKLFNCEPRSVTRMAALGRWPSIKVEVGTKGAGEYRWTNEMVAEIVHAGERQPEAQPAAREPQRQTVQAYQPKPRRTRQPAPIAGSNVRPLVAKQPRRSA